MPASSSAFLVLSPSLLASSFRRQPPAGASRAEIYRLQNCANRHGEEREGTRRALRSTPAAWLLAEGEHP